ncbi:MAG TPA: ABC transporter permease [Fimbriimonadaceae bacterium]|nr:ABC transporter permease [Fimbriimonadaceae bacterium]
MSKWRSTVADYAGMLIALVIIVAGFSSRAPHFLSAATFKTIANEIPEAIFIATGMTFVLIIGGIDLSVGSVAGLAGAILGFGLATLHLSPLMAIPLGIAAGVGCGFVNGFITAQWRLPSFIVTLGMLEMARGGAYLVTDSRTMYVGGPIERIADLSLLGVSLPFILAIATIAGAQFLLARTVFGRSVVAIGSNEEAARFSGIDSRPLKIKVFVLSGLLAAVSAVVGVSRMASADPNAGTGAELQAIAAVVIGGTSLMGGRGTVIGSFFGVVIIALLENGLAQVGAQEPVKRLITGAVIVLAVLVDRFRRNR